MTRRRGRRCSSSRRQSGLHGAGRPRRSRTALNKVPLRVHLSLYDDETSALCHWHVPEAHFLEAWSDARGYDGTASIVQPLIAPLYGGRSAHELLAAMSDRPERPRYDIVRELLAARNQRRPSSTPAWRRWLHDGVIPGTALRAEVTVSASQSRDRGARSAAAVATATAAGLEIAFRHDPAVLDGRFANNGWLQELPKPITKLTWDNAVLMSPATARRLKRQRRAVGHGGEHGQVISRRRRAALSRPHGAGAGVRRSPGHPDDCVTVHLGYGRTRAGRVGSGAGFNAYAHPYVRRALVRRGLRNASAPARRYPLACTQYHHLMEGRGMVRAVTRDEFIARSAVGARRRHRRRRRGRSRCIPTITSTKATSGAWRSTSTRASAATRASSPARRRTTSRSSARSRCCAAARCTGSASTRYYRGEPRQPGDLLPAGAVHALRERAVRGGLPGRRDGAQRRRAERHGLQPLRRHAVLLEQLPVQGAAVQLPALPGLEHAEPQAAAQPRRHASAAAA